MGEQWVESDVTGRLEARIPAGPAAIRVDRDTLPGELLSVALEQGEVVVRVDCRIEWVRPTTVLLRRPPQRRARVVVAADGSVSLDGRALPIPFVSAYAVDTNGHTTWQLDAPRNTRAWRFDFFSLAGQWQWGHSGDGLPPQALRAESAPGLIRLAVHLDDGRQAEGAWRRSGPGNAVLHYPGLLRVAGQRVNLARGETSVAVRNDAPAYLDLRRPSGARLRIPLNHLDDGAFIGSDPQSLGQTPSPGVPYARARTGRGLRLGASGAPQLLVPSGPAHRYASSGQAPRWLASGPQLRSFFASGPARRHDPSGRVARFPVAAAAHGDGAGSLQVALPEHGQAVARRLRITGVVEPNTRVQINGTDADVHDGTFSQLLHFTGERAQIRVRAIDPAGNLATLLREYDIR
jgi:hypothetical protein